MAKLDFDYKVDTDTDKQGGGSGILPHMNACIQVESITQSATKDQRGTQIELTFEVVEPTDYARRKFWAYWTVAHSDGMQYGAMKYGKPRFDKLVRATGNTKEGFEADPDTDHLLFKTFVAEIGIEIGSPDGKGGFYKDKNSIEKFYFDDEGAKEPIPELGVIGDGTQGKKRNEQTAPANDNRPAASNDNRPAAAAATGAKRPWGSK